MAYIKEWDPPMAMAMGNLTTWKAICGDLHQNLLDAGLVQTSTPGQLDISSVSTIPAENSYAGFIEYGFDDDLQATDPVVIKIEYGLGRAGLSNYAAQKIIRLRITVIFNAQESVAIGHPQSHSTSYNSTITQNIGKSFLFYDKEGGRLFVAYGVGAVMTFDSGLTSAGSYVGSILTLCVERTRTNGVEDNRGVIAAFTGFTGINTGSNWVGGAYYGTNSSIRTQAIMSDGPVDPYRNMGLRPGRTNIPYIGTNVQLHPVFAVTPYLEPFTCFRTYVHSQISFDSEFDVTVAPGDTRAFKAIGNETCWLIDGLDGNLISTAIEWEE